MAIQWYPGHMNKARRQIAEAMSSKDVVIEVLDARMPASSANPVVTELRRDKPCLKVLSKADLADPEVTKAWIAALEGQAGGGNVAAIAITSTRAGEVRTRIPDMCKALAPNRRGPGKVVRALVVGIPNVGKSTLINTLKGHKVAKVGDEPAVTKSQQLVTLESGMTLSDNPGILWPSIDPTATLRLALAGAIPDVALDYESVGMFAAELLLTSYPRLVCARYKIDTPPATPAALLDAIGRKRGCLKSGGVVDLHKASDALVHDLRAGTLGRISLERPD